MKKEYKTLLGLFVAYCVFWSILENTGFRITQPIVEWFVIFIGYMPLLILTAKVSKDESIRMRYKVLCWLLSIGIIVSLVSSIIFSLMGIAVF